jgi:hypothetical protein
LERDEGTSLGRTRLPETDHQLVGMIETTFKKLTGIQLPDASAVSDQDFVFVKRYARGGISSGEVSLKFWRCEAIPLLRSRYIMLSRESVNE